MPEIPNPSPPPVIQAPPAPKVEGEGAGEGEAEGGFLDSIEGAFEAIGGDPAAPTLHGEAAQGGVEEAPAPEAKPTEGEAKPTEDTSKPTEGEAKEGEAKEGEAKEGEQSDDPIDQLLDFEPPEDADSGWTPKAAKAFQKSKGVIKQLQEELAEAKSQLGQTSSRAEELEASGDNPTLEQMQARLKEYEQRDMVTNVEKSRPYQELVQEPLTELVKQSDEIAERNSIDPEELIEAISMEDVKARKEALTDLMSGADDEDKYKVYSIIDKMEPIFKRRDAIFANVEDAARELKEIEEQQTKAEKAAALEARTKAAKAVGDRIRERMTFLGEMEGVDLDAMVNEAAAEDPGALDPVKASFNSLSAKLTPKLAREIFRLQKERDALLKQLSDYESAEPGAGGGRAGAGVAAGDDGGGFIDAINSQLGG